MADIGTSRLPPEILREVRPPSEDEAPYSVWNTLCWFVGANAWLEGRTPIEGDTHVNQVDSSLTMPLPRCIKRISSACGW